MGKQFDRCLQRIKSFQSLRVALPAPAERRSEAETAFKLNQETTSSKWIIGALSSNESFPLHSLLAGMVGNIIIICAPGAAAALR